MENVQFILNGVHVSYDGSPEDRLLDVLRRHFGLTSVKCGCREGECGACSVLINGVLTNSCLVAAGAVEGDSIMTLEGYRETEKFRVLSGAFADCCAVQCGFCTPGMLLAAESILSKDPDPDEDTIRTGISGNLCRCTGYNSIVRAIKKAAQDGKGLWKKEELQGPLTPECLEEALTALNSGNYQPYAGGTDLSLAPDTGKYPLFIGKLNELTRIERIPGYISIGAAVTFSEGLESELMPEIMKTAIRKLAGPAVRNRGTFGGNLANASGKADSALVDLVLDARLKICSLSGERYVKVSDFYLGRRKIDLKTDELITEIQVPDLEFYRNFYYEKVSVRTSVAISNLSIAAVWNIEAGIIRHVSVGIGSATDYPEHLRELENYLLGRKIEEFRKPDFNGLGTYISEFDLPPDRTSVEYRKRVCFRLLKYLLKEEFTPVEF